MIEVADPFNRESRSAEPLEMLGAVVDGSATNAVGTVDDAQGFTGHDAACAFPDSGTGSNEEREKPDVDRARRA